MVDEVVGVKNLSFEKLLITDLEQITGFVLLDSDVLEHFESYGRKSLNLKDFKLSVDSKGNTNYYFVDKGDDTFFHKKYFDNWKKFGKMFNCGIMFLYKPSAPLVITLGDCVDERNKAHGVLCYCIAHKTEGV